MHNILGHLLHKGILSLPFCINCQKHKTMTSLASASGKGMSLRIRSNNLNGPTSHGSHVISQIVRGNFRLRYSQPWKTAAAVPHYYPDHSSKSLSGPFFTAFWQFPSGNPPWGYIPLLIYGPMIPTWKAYNFKCDMTCFVCSSLQNKTFNFI